MWIDPTNRKHLLLGTDGGFYVSRDRAANWDFVDNMAAGEFYNVALDNRDPYSTSTADFRTTRAGAARAAPRSRSRTSAPNTRTNGILNDHWFDLGGGDGFHVAVDPIDPEHRLPRIAAGRRSSA